MSSQSPLIAVVGDGIAGCTSIVALKQQGFRPIWIRPERPRPASTWPESIDSAAIDLLSELVDATRLLSICRYSVESHHSCWGSDRLITRLNTRLNQSEKGTHLINKDYLIKHLDQEACQWSSIIRGQIKTISHAEGSWILSLANGNDLKCDALIVASGTNPSIQHQFSHTITTDALLGHYWTLKQPVVAEYRTEAASFVEACATGWWYGVSFNDGSLSLLFMTEPGQRTLMQSSVDFLAQHLKQTVHLKQWIRCQNMRLLSSPYCFKKVCRNLRTFAGQAGLSNGPFWLAVGDAAISHDPLSSFGLTSAIWSAVQAAKRLGQSFDGQGAEAIHSYNREMAAFCNHIQKQRCSVYEREVRFASEPFWIKRRCPQTSVVQICEEDRFFWTGPIVNL